MKLIQGIRVDDLGDQFAGVRYKPGRTLLVDGDGPAYRASSTVAKLETAIRRFETEVLSLAFVTGSEHVRVFLTPRGCQKCNRALYPTAKVYQSNRSGKPKPKLLEPLRDALIQNELPHRDWTFSYSSWFEADDLMIQAGLELGDAGVIWSDDKDLRQAQTPYWETMSARTSVLSDPFGYINLKHTDSGTPKVVGHGRKFFWAQMLMGDSADAVQGLRRYYGKLCGPAAAFNALDGITDEVECASHVIDAYIAAEQDVLAEAQMLWLRRSAQDCAARYLLGLELPKYQHDWVQALHEYHTQVLALKEEELC
jgi:hypothetical protein